MSLTEEQKIIWKNHIIASAEHPVGIQHYCFEQKISKSSLYRWKSLFSKEEDKHIQTTSSKQADKASKIKTACKSSPFLPAIVETLDLKNKKQLQDNNLPDPTWLAEVIVKVIRGLS